jgi:hypothetical protein
VVDAAEEALADAGNGLLIIVSCEDQGMPPVLHQGGTGGIALLEGRGGRAFEGMSVGACTRDCMEWRVGAVWVDDVSVRWRDGSVRCAISEPVTVVAELGRQERGGIKANHRKLIQIAIEVVVVVVDIQGDRRAGQRRG